MLVALMTAFTFTSCEDVPAPYDIPNGGNGGNGGGSSEMAGNGTAENPYTVEDIKGSGATGSNVYVKAYIVGFVPGKAMDEAKFTAEGCEATSNVLIAASPDETSVDNVMPVQLPVGAVRDAINLKDNPANLKQEVVLCGNIEAYFGKTGLKAVVWAKLGDKEFGAKPGTETGGGSDITGTPKGTGTKDDPFNSVAANQMASKLASGAKTDKQYYIKGKVVSVKEAFSAQYGNASSISLMTARQKASSSCSALSILATRSGQRTSPTWQLATRLWYAVRSPTIWATLLRPFRARLIS